MPESAPGRIITFYSFKGGTGRTMALANTAWVLASNGYRVLMIDWDLEAPGLHRYLHPFLGDKRLASTKGMIDFVFDYQRRVLKLPEQDGARQFPDTWFDEQVDVLQYTTELVWSQKGFGELHLLPAGQQLAEYGERVNTFNWRQLYENLGGFQLFEAMKRQLLGEFDFVLIDSRTGVSDTSGICTVQMPDTLVVCFTLNSQSIEGASEVALSVTEQREAEYKEGKFRVFPVPTRLEKAEKQKLELARDAARSKFDTFLTNLTAPDRERYWGEVEIFYEPFYAYEEVLAAFADKPGAISSLRASIERLTARLTDGTVDRMQNIPTDERLKILAEYERSQATPANLAEHAAAVFNRLGAQQQEIARKVLLRLVVPGVGGTVFRTAVATHYFPEQERGIMNRLVDEGVLTRKLPEDGETEYVMIADERLVETWPSLRGWIQDQADVLKFRRILEDRAARWESSKRHWSMLLSEGEIPQARAAVEDLQSVSPVAEAFVRESVATQDVNRKKRDEAETQRRLQRSLLYGLGAAAVLAIIFFASQRYILPKISDFLTLRRLQTKVDKFDLQKYVWVPPGQFIMGCSEDTGNFGYYGCSSVDVQISTGFWMGQTEVTNAAYRKFLAAQEPDQLDAFPAAKFPDKYPASNVVWLEAYGYCAWVGGALPSEAQWEYAARAGIRGKRYITGDTLDENKISIGSSPKPVGSFSPNAFGLFDMSGNVAEWSGDTGGYIPAYLRPAGGILVDPSYSPSQLRGFSGGIRAMAVRGGSYDSVARDLRLDANSSQPFDQPDPRTGFRCIIPASDLDQVATNYQAFSELYGAYSRVYHFGYFGPYQNWWDEVYLRSLNNADHPK